MATTRRRYTRRAIRPAHHDRMNRDTLKEGMAAGFGSPEYAREELRAEISAMMSGEQVGVGHGPATRGGLRRELGGGAGKRPA